MSHRVEFSPEALGDLIDLYDYIALRDGPERAIGYIAQSRRSTWASPAVRRVPVSR